MGISLSKNCLTCPSSSQVSVSKGFSGSHGFVIFCFVFASKVFNWSSDQFLDKVITFLDITYWNDEHRKLKAPARHEHFWTKPIVYISSQYAFLKMGDGSSILFGIMLNRNQTDKVITGVCFWNSFEQRPLPCETGLMDYNFLFSLKLYRIKIYQGVSKASVYVHVSKSPD